MEIWADVLVKHAAPLAPLDPETDTHDCLDRGLADTHVFYEGAGCVDCAGTGYRGRTAICELLGLSDRIREMILDRRPSSEIKRVARDEGMRFLRECAVARVMEGMTTLREIDKVTFVE